MKRVYFVRHGLSESNVAGIVSGAEDDADLTDEGRAGARRAGQDLKGKGIELIVCSPMKRTVETAEIIAREIGYDPSKIVRDERFIERRVGHLSRRSHEEYREFVRSGQRVDGVEHTDELADRVRAGLDTLKTYDADTILVVAHGGVGRAVHVVANNLHHEEMYKLDSFKNTEIYEFTLE